MFYFLNNSAKEFIEFTLLTLLLLIKLFAFLTLFSSCNFIINSKNFLDFSWKFCNFVNFQFLHKNFSA